MCIYVYIYIYICIRTFTHNPTAISAMVHPNRARERDLPIQDCKHQVARGHVWCDRPATSRSHRCVWHGLRMLVFWHLLSDAEGTRGTIRTSNVQMTNTHIAPTHVKFNHLVRVVVRVVGGTRSRIYRSSDQHVGQDPPTWRPVIYNTVLSQFACTMLLSDAMTSPWIMIHYSLWLLVLEQLAVSPNPLWSSRRDDASVVELHVERVFVPTVVYNNIWMRPRKQEIRKTVFL